MAGGDTGVPGAPASPTSGRAPGTEEIYKWVAGHEWNNVAGPATKTS